MPRKFCLDCDKKLGEWEKTRCKECRYKKIVPFENRHGYTKPGSTAKPEINAVYVKMGNTLEHEMGKLAVVWTHGQEGHVCLTEAKDPQTGDILDVICLTCGPVEVVKTHGDKEYYASKGRQTINV